MRYQFITDHRQSGLRIGRLCALVNVSSSGYYAWCHRTPSVRALANEKLIEKIKTAHQQSRRNYGSPRIAIELRAQGESCGRHRVARLMRNEGIRAKTNRQFKGITTTRRDQSHPVTENLLQQNFVAERPNVVWTSDITYLWTAEGWLYLAVILDVCSRQIVGYALSHRLTTDIVLTALRRALAWRTPEPGMMLHSDRGSQYTSADFQQLLAVSGIRSSMSASGNCYDNAITESFFHTLKTEHVYFEHFENQRSAEQSLFDYIEIFYNRQRRHSAIKYLSPVQFEQQLIMS